MPKQPKKKESIQEGASPVLDVTRSRHIKAATRTLLCIRAGGICELGGCLTYLFEHPVRLEPGNFAQFAHIVAFKPDGPRGDGNDAGRPPDIHAIDNLMLLCPACHKLVDDNPTKYPRTYLEKQKTEHEHRIRHVTSMKPGDRTVVVQVKANVRGQKVDLPFQDIATAVDPRFPASNPGHVIDLSVLDTASGSFYEEACRKIDREVSLYYGTDMPIDLIRHVSLFAIGPIPTLVYLGSKLSDVIPVDLYQRHRDSQDWVWKNDGPEVGYQLKTKRKGSDPIKVALVLSLSGTIPDGQLPAELDQTYSLYEITLDGQNPNLDFLRRREDLIAFEKAYREFFAFLDREHPESKELALLPAVPTPIAVACGLRRLRDIRQRIHVYNNEGPPKGFVHSLTIEN